MVSHLSVEQRQLALRLRARSLSLRQIGPQAGCSHELVRIIARGARWRGFRPRMERRTGSGTDRITASICPPAWMRAFMALRRDTGAVPRSLGRR
jgi:hypothetical protein